MFVDTDVHVLYVCKYNVKCGKQMASVTVLLSKHYYSLKTILQVKVAIITRSVE
jgi:hypothetical protein